MTQLLIEKVKVYFSAMENLLHKLKEGIVLFLLPVLYPCYDREPLESSSPLSYVGYMVN